MFMNLEPHFTNILKNWEPLIEEADMILGINCED
jgi:hypothetical protein